MAQVHEKKPTIITENLQPKSTIAGYKFTWQERGLLAWSELLPINDRPARGFILEAGYDTLSGREPGARQIDLGTTLTGNVRELMLGQMALAGWREIGRDEKRRPIWQHESRIAAPASSAPALQEKQDQAPRKTLYVPARERVTSYKRTITASDVTYTCARCKNDVTKSLFPGATPLYCDICAAEVKREQTRKRVRRLRAGKKHAS